MNRIKARLERKITKKASLSVVEYKGYTFKETTYGVEIWNDISKIVEVATEEEAKQWVDDHDDDAGVMASYDCYKLPAVKKCVQAWDNLDTDISEDEWNTLLNGIKNQKIYDFAEKIMMDEKNPKFTATMIEGLNYVDEQGLDDRKLDYVLAYVQNRITTDQLGDFSKSIKNITNLIKKADADILPETEQEFIDLTVGSGNTLNARRVCEKCGKTWDEDVLLDIMLYTSEFCNNDYKNHNITDVVTMKYLYDASDANVQAYLDAKQREPLKSLKPGAGKQAIRAWFAQGKDTNNEYFQFVINNCDKFKPKSNPRGIAELLDDSVSDEEKKKIMNGINTVASRRATNRIAKRLRG